MKLSSCDVTSCNDLWRAIPVMKPKVFSTDSYLACMTMVAISLRMLTAYRRVDIALLLPFKYSLGVESLARLLPALFLFLSLSFYFTHLQTRWTTNKNGSSTVTATSFLSTFAIKPRHFIPKWRRVWALRVYRHGVN